jgi:sulfatase maturation enzyme AslB (radical SAM superfamily)
MNTSNNPDRPMRLIERLLELYRKLTPMTIRVKLMPFLSKLLPKLGDVDWQLKDNLIPYLQFMITDHCNLNCVSCTVCSPIAEKNNFSKESLSSDINRMNELTGGKVGTIRILGGEPLLHPDLLFVVSELRKKFKRGIISLITNGILLLKESDEFWKCCKRNAVLVQVSYYPINLNYKEINKKARKYGKVFPNTLPPPPAK